MNYIRRCMGITGVFLFIFMVSCTYSFFPASYDYPAAGPMRRVATFPDILWENSGLQYDSGTILTFNDSGGEPILYRLDSNLTLLSQNQLLQSTNIDWEDITSDNKYCYIADVGNNFGGRDTLTIYRVQKKQLYQSSGVTLPERITFSFNDSTTRNGSGYYSHDCEALLVYEDSLYIFTKDWVSYTTRIYTLPTTPGHYNIWPRERYSVDALITGADIIPGKQEITLVGYKKVAPYLYFPVVIKYGFDTDPAHILKGGRARKYPLRIGTQVEGVCYDEKGNIMVSSEKALKKPGLFRVD